MAGCGSTENGPAGDTAQAFHAALAAGDGARGCALVAPRTSSALEESSGLPCPRAVLAQHLAVVSRPESVRVFGTMAEVRYADEVTFLARFPDGWRVVAAACAPTTRDRPHDCRIQGA
jgi:hypothetical protein